MQSPPNDQLEDFLRAAPAALVSLIVHLILLLVLGLLALNDVSQEPLVLEIAQALPESEVHLETPSFELPADLPPPPSRSEVVNVTEVAEVELGEISNPLDVIAKELDFEVSSEFTTEEFASKEFDQVSAEQFAAVEGVSIEFGKDIQYAQKHGMDIVIVFDSTGSMGSEISEVKRRISVLGTMILRKIPRARFSLITYRDVGDLYLVRGTPLTAEVKDLTKFIRGVEHGGGGDAPEAVQAGMGWAMNRLYFGEKTKKAMLIFGDAPPHSRDLRDCVHMARIFHRKGGQVSTITCRAQNSLPEFYQIALAGGGDAYIMQNANRLMEQLLILAFGREHREDVLKFFELDGRMPRLN
ncbi:MAG: hypothetical protein AB8B91_11675 [Rubripirellula sp.]